MIDMVEYVSNQENVFAGEITAENIGDTIQELFDNGANYLALNSYPVNRLDATDTDTHTGLIVSIRGQMYSIVLGDYLVEEEGEFGTVLFPMKKDVFESRYSPVEE